jgi:hypothetical protein
MGPLLRWPLLPILLIGIANIAVWYGFAFSGLSWQWSLTFLVNLAWLAGWYTREKLWGTVIVLLIPTMFIGGEQHGQPWQWLVYSFGYFVQNMAPIILAYFAVFGIGRLTKAKLVQRLD